MKTLTENWKYIATAIIFILVGILFTRYCTSPKVVTSNQVSLDSLQMQNDALNHRADRLSDSILVVVQEKNKVQAELSKQLNSVIAKYQLLRNSRPSVDTIVKTHTVYLGQEAIEKVPILEAQLKTCNSEVEDYKNLVIVKNNQNSSLQGQFEQCMAISQGQEKEPKKLKRKVRWLKIGLITETVVLLGTAAVVIAQ